LFKKAVTHISLVYRQKNSKFKIGLNPKFYHKLLQITLTVVAQCK